MKEKVESHVWLEGAGGEGQVLGARYPRVAAPQDSPALWAPWGPRGRSTHQAEAAPHVGTWTLQPAWLSTVHRGPFPGDTQEVTAPPAGRVRELHWLRCALRLDQCRAQSAVQLSICLFKAEAGGEEGVEAGTWRVSRNRPTEEAVLGVWLLNSRAVDCA